MCKHLSGHKAVSYARACVRYVHCVTAFITCRIGPRQAISAAPRSPHLAAWSDSSGVACRLCIRIMHIRRRCVILRARAAP